MPEIIAEIPIHERYQLLREALRKVKNNIAIPSLMLELNDQEIRELGIGNHRNGINTFSMERFIQEAEIAFLESIEAMNKALKTTQA